MFWIISSIVLAIAIIAGKFFECKYNKTCYHYDCEIGFFTYFLITICAFIIFICASVAFFVGKKNYNFVIDNYNLERSQIVYSLDSYNDNVNYLKEFSVAIEQAKDFNESILKENYVYKNWKTTFGYHDERIESVEYIDLTKYKIKDANVNIKITANK